MESLWTPLFGLMVFTLIFGVVGGFIASKTKAIVSSVIVGCLIYLVGYLAGIIPTDSIANTGITTMMTSFGVSLMVTNLGTMINLKDLIKEWKTVIIAVSGLVGIALIAFTLGTWIFGRDYALSAASPISGGIIATILTTTAANAAGRPDLAAFATLIVSFQLFLGLPIASKCLKVEADHLLKNKNQATLSESSENVSSAWNLKILPDWPEWTHSPEFIIFKLAFVAVISTWISNLTLLPGHSQPIINASILSLILGVIFTEIGFLDRQSLQKANAFGLLMIGLLALLPGNFASVDIAALKDMILPLVGMIVLGVIGIGIFSVIVGKAFKYSVPMSIAIGVTALFGYPCTQLVTDEVVDALEADDDEKELIRNALLPKMLIGGFTTVSIASVIFAGIIVPLIF